MFNEGLPRLASAAVEGPAAPPPMIIRFSPMIYLVQYLFSYCPALHQLWGSAVSSILIGFWWNFPSGGRPRLPVASCIEPVGQTSIQLPQAKQSGIILSCFRIAPITVDGQAFSQDRQPMHVS